MGASQATGLAGAEAPEPHSRLGPTGGIPCAMDLSDPMERLIAAALDVGGFTYLMDFGGGNPSGLDFRITGPMGDGVEIEVKRFHSPRIAEQMSRATDVIAVQGPVAASLFAHLLVCRKAALVASGPKEEEDG